MRIIICKWIGIDISGNTISEIIDGIRISRPHSTQEVKHYRESQIEMKV